MVIQGYGTGTPCQADFLSHVEHHERHPHTLGRLEIESFEMLDERFVSDDLTLELIEKALPIIPVEFELHAGIDRVRVLVRGIQDVAFLVVGIGSIRNFRSGKERIECDLEIFTLEQFGRLPLLGQRNVILGRHHHAIFGYRQGDIFSQTVNLKLDLVVLQRGPEKGVSRRVQSFVDVLLRGKTGERIGGGIPRKILNRRIGNEHLDRIDHDVPKVGQGGAYLQLNGKTGFHAAHPGIGIVAQHAEVVALLVVVDRVADLIHDVGFHAGRKRVANRIRHRPGLDGKRCLPDHHVFAVDQVGPRAEFVVHTGGQRHQRRNCGKTAQHRARRCKKVPACRCSHR